MQLSPILLTMTGQTYRANKVRTSVLNHVHCRASKELSVQKLKFLFFDHENRLMICPGRDDCQYAWTKLVSSNIFFISD